MTPFGHCLAGAIVWFGYKRTRWQMPSLPVALVAANLPDLDFLPGVLSGDLDKYHHGATHSIGAAMVAAVLLASAWKLWKHDETWWKLALFFGSCVLSHVIADYFTLDYGEDAGIPVFWPLSGVHHMSPVVIFLDVWREPLFAWFVIKHNLHNMLIEAAVFLPPLMLLVFFDRRKVA